MRLLGRIECQGAFRSIRVTNFHSKLVSERVVDCENVVVERFMLYILCLTPGHEHLTTYLSWPSAFYNKHSWTNSRKGQFSGVDTGKSATLDRHSRVASSCYIQRTLTAGYLSKLTSPKQMSGEAGIRVARGLCTRRKIYVTYQPRRVIHVL